MFGAVLGQQSNALLRQQNARGGIYSGTAIQAGGRLGLENYGNYMTRLQGQGSQGLTAAGQQSNIRLGQADMRYGLGATQAGSEINYGNAQAQNRGVLGNSLLNLAGTAAKAYAASDIRLKRDIERIGTLPSGLPTYSFKYVYSDEPMIGVMAHEAEKIFPNAIAYNEHGFASVDYSQIR